MREFPVLAIGRSAEGYLIRAKSGRVWGITARGLFLRLEQYDRDAPGRIIFLSSEVYHGPLSLNLGGEIDCLKDVVSGASVQIETGRIIFIDYDLAIVSAGARVWQAPEIPGELLPAEQRMARLGWLAEALLRRKGFAGAQDFQQSTAGLAGSLMALSGLKWGPVGFIEPYRALLEPLQAALSQGQALQLAERLHPWLGLGSGLTPSGDDLVMGLLLGLNRWGLRLGLKIDLQLLNQALLQTAYLKTTLLSANLIEAASSGQADERLLRAQDGLFSDQPGTAESVDYLAGWGNSSGLDALCGMALVVRAAQNT